jgi:sphingosine kinase
MSKENFGPLESIFYICKSNTAPLDIASYNLANSSKTYTSFLTFTWGLIADCDLDSECLRWLGSLRQDIWAVYRGILFPKIYRAKFSYLPPISNVEYGLKERVIPEFGKPLPEEWVTIEDDFKVFWASNVSHPAYNMKLCPMAQMNDGMIHIIVVR